MKQYQLHNNTLVLNVKKSPVFVRGLLFFGAFICFAAPLLGIATAISLRQEFKIGYLISIFLFGLIGFFMLRHALWNSFGKETITFYTADIVYEADYKWFKDGKKSMSQKAPMFTIAPIGFTEDQTGTLSIQESDARIDSVVKLPIKDLKLLIQELEEKHS